MKAILLLEDGTVFEGESIGVPGTTIGEVVFATSMTGFQEMLTDPSFAGQLLTFTYPLIGNYGVNDEDIESGKVQAAGIIVRELCDVYSNWRATGSLADYLETNNVVGLKGIDTRALTRHLREAGVMMGAISTEYDEKELAKKIKKAPNYGNINLVERVSTDEAYSWTAQSFADIKPENPKCKITLIDLGIKRSIARRLAWEDSDVTVLPYNATPVDVEATEPDGLVFSSGPGDPRQLYGTVNTMKAFIGKCPILGICLGHQLFGMAMGGEIVKLKFGHRGANHPVKKIFTGKVSITAQNHGYAVSEKGLSSEVVVERVNLNDGTIEGLRHKDLPIFTIQYHPEASAGPNDDGYLFKQFIDSVMAAKK